MSFTRSYVIILAFLVNFTVMFAESKFNPYQDLGKQGIMFGKNEPRIKIRHSSLLPEIITTTTKPTTCPVIYHPLRCEPNTVLNFTRTGLTKIGDFFVNSTDTRKLYLDYNDISEISPKAFEALPNLQTLSVRGNNISVSKLLHFKEHNALNSLMLDENRYRGDNMIVKSMLEPLPNLRYLSLRDNKISRMDVSMKMFAPRLVHLDLSGNDIASTDFLINLSSTVENVQLNDNAISNMERGLENVKVLSLSGNNFTILCRSRCSGLSLVALSKLELLNLSRNTINKIMVNAFLNMPFLRTLDLSENNLNTLPNDAFNGLPSLEELRLARNKFMSVPNMCQLQRIRHVDLSWNKIQMITGTSFCANQCYIKRINLAGNRISSIRDGTFYNLVQLEILDLSSNLIDELPIQLIDTAKHLQVLLLKNNRIMSIDELFNVKSNQLSELHLQDNPLPSLRVYILPELTIHLKDLTPIVQMVDVTTTEASNSDELNNNDDSRQDGSDYNFNDDENGDISWGK